MSLLAILSPSAMKQISKLMVLYFESRELHSPTPITTLRVGLHASLASRCPGLRTARAALAAGNS
jgi:hypothetical protein